MRLALPRAGWWPRLRHSRGFGVHSPFAYAFIRDAIRGHYAYYAYELADAVPARAAELRLLVRVCAFLNPSCVAVSAADTDARRIVSAVCPSASLVVSPSGEVQLTVFAPDMPVEGAEACALAGGAVILPEGCSELCGRLASHPCGHTYVNAAGRAIHIGKHHLPAQTIPVWF